MDIRIGDRVTCIQGNTATALLVGETHEVERVDGGFVRLQGLPGWHWARRFERVERGVQKTMQCAT